MNSRIRVLPKMAILEALGGWMILYNLIQPWKTNMTMEKTTMSEDVTIFY